MAAYCCVGASILLVVVVGAFVCPSEQFFLSPPSTNHLQAPLSPHLRVSARRDSSPTLAKRKPAWIPVAVPAHRLLLRENTHVLRSTEADSVVPDGVHAASNYVGPVGELGDMEAGCLVGNLGLEIMIGPSCVAPGRGLFVRVAAEEGVDQVTLDAGTLISGYSKTGSWATNWAGDKAVAFAFDSPDTTVVYDKELMPLIEAVSIADGVDDNITAGVTGHIVFFDEETQELKIAPDLDWSGARYFIPSEAPKSMEASSDWEWGPSNFGICANDLAYSPGASSDEYMRAAADKNVLQLVWRMHVDEQKKALAPSWPVVFLQRPVVFANRQPMEIGISYGHRYWQSTEEEAREDA